MKKSFTRFLKRNLAFFRLAIVSNLEYRLNYFIDAIVQPVLTAAIELMLWAAIFRSAHTDTIGGYGKNDYLAYVIWTAFIARITVTWMYEHRMIEEIESGTVNGLLVRPMSFFEYYLSQFFGYKIVTALISLIVPLVAIVLLKLPTDLTKLPLVLALIFYYLVFVHLISFIISTFAFHFHRVFHFTGIKNLVLFVVSGELIPLDLYPEPFRALMKALPFSSGVYVPVGYLTGRIDLAAMLNGFQSTTLSILILAPIAIILWFQGLRKYSGTGA